MDKSNYYSKTNYYQTNNNQHFNSSLTSSPGSNVVSVVVTGKKFNDQLCPVWANILDCQDGSFIIQYKLIHTCTNLKINIKIYNQEVLVITRLGPIYEEECPCPNESVKNWLETNECSTNHPQMDEDLRLFPSINFDQIRDGLIKRFHKPDSISICHYVIKQNQVSFFCFFSFQQKPVLNNEIMIDFQNMLR